MKKTISFFIAAVMVMAACERLDDNHGVPVETGPQVRPDQLAMILSEIDMGKEQLWEVHDAVTSSSGNGYDEEYTMGELTVDDPDALELTNEKIGDGGANIMYRFTDIYGNQYWTPAWQQ